MLHGGTVKWWLAAGTVLSGGYSRDAEIAVTGCNMVAIDSATTEKIMDLIMDIMERNLILCLMVTHNMHSILGSRTWVLEDGKGAQEFPGRDRTGAGYQLDFTCGVGRECGLWSYL